MVHQPDGVASFVRTQLLPALGAILMFLVATVPTVEAASSGPEPVRIQLSRHVGPPTTPFKVSGRGFDSREIVDVAFDDEVLASVTTGPTGSFATKVHAPESALPGTHVVSATGQTSGLHAERSFLVRTDWPMAQFGPDRTGSNPFENALSPETVGGLTQAWTVPASDLVGRAPVVAGGIAYFTAYDGTVYALDVATGEQRWTAQVDTFLGPDLIAVANGMVYVPAQEIHAFDARTGATVWTAPIRTAFQTGVLPVGDRIYLEGYSGDVVDLFALDAFSGEVIWSNYVDDYDVNGPPAYADGIVYATVGNIATLLAFDADTGALLWGRALHHQASGSAAVAGGVVFAGTDGQTSGGTFYAFDAATGRTRWSFHDGEINFPGSPAVADGRVIVTANSGYSDPYWIYSFDAATGEVAWVAPLEGFVGILHYPVEANGVIYAADYDERLTALDASNGQVLWQFVGTLNFTVPTIADGSIYFGSFDRTMYAFRLPGQSIRGP